MATEPGNETEIAGESPYVYEEEQKRKSAAIPPAPQKSATVGRQDSNLYDLPDGEEGESDEEFDSISEKGGDDAKKKKQNDPLSLSTFPPKAETIIACIIFALVFGGLGVVIGHYGLGNNGKGSLHIN